MPSRVKAEKVVNPPQIPVIKNNFQFSLLSKDLNERPQKIPIAKQPTILTVSVAQGIGCK
jgi:hypothetical protein